MERSFIHKRALVTVVLLCSFVLSFLCVSNFTRSDVRADGSISVSTESVWADGFTYVITLSDYPIGTRVTLYLCFPHEVTGSDLSSVWNSESVSTVNDNESYVTVLIDYSPKMVGGTVSGMDLGTDVAGFSATVYSEDYSGVTTTAAPTPTPRPATPTPRPATTSATVVTTTASATVAETSADDESDEETSPAEVTETSVSGTSATSETTEETTDESTEESTDGSSEETMVILDNPTLVADMDKDDPKETEATPTTAAEPVVVARTKPSGGSSRWILILAVLLVITGFRYVQLKRRDLSGGELAMEFIPGRVIGRIADKIRPPKTVDPAPAETSEEKPKVINGYLQTSNTRTIRPEFSNAAALAKLEDKKTAGSTLPGVKPPVKRPASASVNHAAAAAGTAGDKPADKHADDRRNNNQESQKSDTEIVTSAASERAIMSKEKKSSEDNSAQMNRRPNQSRNTMNRPDKDYLNPNATPTVAAMAFERAMHENAEKPAIATQYVPPVIEKEEVRRPSPFKQIKRPTGADVEAAAQVVKEEEKKARPNIALNFIPAAKVQKEEINPFKSNKGPIKRTGDAALNKANAQAEDDGEQREPEAEEPKKMSFTAALREHERSKSFRPSGEFGGQNKIDPFKHNVDSEGNIIKPDAPEEL